MRDAVLRLYGPVHRLDIAPRDRQPDAKAFRPRGVRHAFSAGREIALEDLIELGRQHTRALVANLDMRDVALLAHPHQDLAAGGREGGGVVDQVLDDRFDDGFAAEHIDAGRQLAAQAEIAARQECRTALDQLAEEPRQIDWPPWLGDEIGSRLVEPPRRGDQPVQPVERMIDPLDRAPPPSARSGSPNRAGRDARRGRPRPKTTRRPPSSPPASTAASRP